MLFDPKNCRCVESEAHKRFRERLASIDPTEERLLEAIFGEPEPKFADSLCEQCLSEEAFKKDLERRGYPEYIFDWDDPEPDDYAIVAEVHNHQQFLQVQEIVATGVRLPTLPLRERTMYWAGISSLEDLDQVMMIGYVVLRDRQLRDMTEEEKEEDQRIRQNIGHALNEFLQSDEFVEYVKEMDHMKEMEKHLMGDDDEDQ